MLTPEEIEQDFNTFFEGIGFKRVSELVGESPNFDNADYIHESGKTIVELKVIDKDYFEEGGVIDSLNAIIMKPVNIKETGAGQYTFKLPDERRGKHDSLEEPIKRILKKANKQLKETNKRLLNNEGVGFVMIVLNNQTSIDPTLVRDLIANILERENSAIDGFILISAPLSSEYLQYPIPVVMPNSPYEPSHPIQKSCTYIGEQWVYYFDSKRA